MPLPGYGLLVGTVIASRPQSGGHPHWLLMVQPKLANHPPYRVAVNLRSTDPGSPPEIEYQVIDVEQDGSPALKALVKQLVKGGATNSFTTGQKVPSLDFVRDGLLDTSKFKQDAGQSPGAQQGNKGKKGKPAEPPPALASQFEAVLEQVVQTEEKAGALVAVFGTGYPINQATGTSPSTGYTGVDNIHMNQGSPNRVGAGSHYMENGPNQDGALIFLLPDGAKAFFVKFQSQIVDTDSNGNPTVTDHPLIDAKLKQARTVLASSRVKGAIQARSGAAPTPAAAATPAGAYTFADADNEDGTETFIPDDDKFFHTPWVQGWSSGQTRGPVPTPRGDTLNMDLTSVVGKNVPGYGKDAGGASITFDMIGDSGAVTAGFYKGELAVGDLICSMAKQAQPAFLYHVGDVVYYYGEKQFYYGQFAEVFREYPAPIFAIPGNHDGLTHDSSMVSLDSFMAAFCAEKPGTWDGFGGVRRSTMTQPGVYFTLDAPLVSIIGLYSNCGESEPWLNDHQYAFLLSELERLKPIRDANERAVLLTIHHMPRWFPGRNDPVSKALDASFVKAGLWPDAVVVGHAHLYQRIVRQKGVGGAPRDIPYIINGAGGYKIMATQKLGGQYVEGLPGNLTAFVPEEGFLKVKVSKAAASMQLNFDYYSTKRPHEVADSCGVDLLAGKLT